MSVEVNWTGYGPESASALAAVIARLKGADPLAPVTVVVPSNQVGVATRRRLADGSAGPVADRGTGVAGVTFVTPFRLAEQLGAAPLAAAGRRPVSVPVIAAALRRALADRPGVFAPVAAHPATEQALVATYRELREAAPAELTALAGTGRRAAEVVRLHRAARATLEPGWYDEQDLMAAATEALRTTGAGELGRLVVYLPQRLSPHAVSLLRVAAESQRLAIVAGRTGDEAADAEVVDSVVRLGGAPPSGPASGRLGVSADRTVVVTTSDPDDEVRAAVRAVVDAARSGTPLDRMAVLYASPVPSLRLAHDHLRAAGIAVNGPAVQPLSARIAGRVLLGGFALARRDVRRDELFTWLGDAPIRADGGPAPVATWERLSREAGVVAGADWGDRLLRLADQREAEAAAEAASPEGSADRARRRREDAAEARRLSRFALGLRAQFAPERGGVASWRAHADWALGFLRESLGPTDAWAATDSAAEPALRAERRAAERVERAVERLATLDSVEGPVAIDVFARTLEIELDHDLGRSGRFGEGVLVGPVGFALGLDLDLVVVLGLAEGTFPAAVHDDSLVPDDDRAVVGPALAPRSARVERQHRELLAALASGARHHLSFPRGDLRRNTERTPSRWLLEAVSELHGGPVWPADLEGLDVPWLHHVASFDAGIRGLTSPATAQEHRLRSLLASGGDAPAGLDAPDTVTRAGVTAAVARRSAAFTRFDGHVEGTDIPSPTERVVSASRMEAWGRCPFAYFVRHVLDVAEIENPEDAESISPRDQGSLIHEVLERFVEEVLARPDAERPDPDDRWTLADRARLRAIGEEVCDRYQADGRTGRDLYWRRDRLKLLAHLDRFLDLDEEHRAVWTASPVATEMPFGTGGAIGAVTLPLTDGRSLSFRGSADRVDVAADGSVHVIDYKTGRANAFTKLCETEPDLGGTKLQLPVYAAAARASHGSATTDVHARYWFPTAAPKHRMIGYHVTPEVMDRVSVTLTTIVEGIERGVFAPHPTAGSSSPRVECPACDPDALGVTELRRAWDRKRHDPLLAPYARLAEPEESLDATTEGAS